MRRIQCLVCSGFMDWEPKRLCSEDCKRVMDERNKQTVEMGKFLREAKEERSRERKKKKEEMRKKRLERRALKRARRDGKLKPLKEKIEKQAEKIRILKQGRKPNGFYESRDWQNLRYRILRMYGRKCMCCGASDCELHVDHIKPRSKYPNLELSIDNLQVLCRACNLGKGAGDETDWRPHKQVSTA